MVTSKFCEVPATRSSYSAWLACYLALVGIGRAAGRNRSLHGIDAKRATCYSSETTYSGRWTDFGTSINFALWIKVCLASACGGSMDNGEGQ